MRRKAAPKRDLLPDPKYHSELLAKFINHLMLSGKRSLAERIVYGALEAAEKRMKGKLSEGDDRDRDGDGAGGSANQPNPIRILSRAISNVRPTVEVKARRVGGATYQVPMEVRHARGMSLGMRWLISSAKTRNEKDMAARLAAEIVEACEGRGNAVKKREDTHRMAKANQAFAHYRW
jgi:small subunit ribosomal protein S7